MAVFNYYAGREKIPVLGSEAEIVKIASASQPGYLLIHDKDLKELKYFSANREIAGAQRIGRRRWFLIKLPRPAS